MLYCPKVFCMKANVKADAVKKNERIAELLAKMGISEKLARIVVLLSAVGEAGSRTIEREANLRQPEVSLGMKELRELGWVDERQVKNKGKGRPFKLYRLKRPLKEIVSEVVERKRKEIKELEKRLEELEELMEL